MLDPLSVYDILARTRGDPKVMASVVSTCEAATKCSANISRGIAGA